MADYFYIRNAFDGHNRLMLSNRGGMSNVFWTKTPADEGSWTTYDFNTQPELTVRGEKIYLRGTNTTLSSSTNQTPVINCAQAFDVGDDITTLLAPSGNLLDLTGKNYVFYKVFSTSKVQDAGDLKLPSTTLSEHSYDSMFYNCSLLAVAPELPARILADGCYNQMFQNCPSLMEARVIKTNLTRKYSTNPVYDGTGIEKVSMRVLNSDDITYSSWTGDVLTENNLINMRGFGKIMDSIYFYIENAFGGENQLQIAKEEGRTLEYKYSKYGEWKPYNFDAQPIMRYLGDKIYLRGTNNTFKCKKTTTTNDKGEENINYYSAINCTQIFNVGGDVTTLLDPNGNVLDLTGRDNTFEGLLVDSNINDITHVVLPSTTLSAFCYSYMFCNTDPKKRGRISRVNKYLLPAKKLAKDCYNGMFQLTELTESPILPATELAEGCYFRMLGGTKIKYTPILPATTLFKNCYKKMFVECKNLQEAYGLPAETVAEGCYNQMFAGCSSLTRVPEILPAKTVFLESYFCMFANCLSLKYAPDLPATTLDIKCYAGMFEKCKSLVRIPKVLPATVLPVSCYDGMFDECLSLTYASEIAATQVAKRSCCCMYAKCSSLTTAPATLPAMSLSEECYAAMFTNCPSLLKTPNLPATTLARACYSQMFWSCTSLTQAPSVLPAMNLATECYRDMFNECKSLTQAPELPATTLAEFCYCYMFNECTSLTKVPSVLPAKVLAPICYNSMFANCTSITETPEANITQLDVNCCAWMFGGCSKLKTTHININSNGLYRSCLCMYDSCFSLTNTGTVNLTSSQEASFQQMYHATSITSARDVTVSANGPTGAAVMFAECPNLVEPPTIIGDSVGPQGCIQMFLTCTSLTSAPELPATNVDTQGYAGMFIGCSALKTAPSIVSATTLGAGACLCMFQQCTSLVKAPEISATTLANQCCAAMFTGCTALTTPPSVLPATTLADMCYNEMFFNCSSLTTSPELPATTLANTCYTRMFWNCSSLITPPSVLPATTLTDGCYQDMFSECVSLTAAPSFTVEVVGSQSCESMFRDCKLIENVDIHLNANDLKYACYRWLFVWCNKLKHSPALPAMNLAKDCYHGMFINNYELMEAPELPATKMVEGCYSYMFKWCTKLTQAPKLHSMELAVGCYADMFYGDKFEVAPELPATILAPYCYSSMFINCVNLTQAPKLPATKLEPFCYGFDPEYEKDGKPDPRGYEFGIHGGMFENCTKLTNIEVAAAEWIDQTNWVKGVAKTGTFTKPTTTVIPEGVNGIPIGWSVTNV